MDDIASRVKAIIVENLQIDEEKITLDASFTDTWVPSQWISSS